MLQRLTTPEGTALLALIGIVIAVLALFVEPSYIWQLINRIRGKQDRPVRERSKFPFDQLSVDDFKRIELQTRLGVDYEIPYLKRLPAEKHEEMFQDWLKILNGENPYLVIKGIGGLGKTREALELLRRLEETTLSQGNLTILMPRPDMDIPLDLDTNLNLNFKNMILFIDDVNKLITLTRMNEGSTFQERLQQVIEHFQRLCKGYGLFRVILTVRLEPELYDVIEPDHEVWKKFSFNSLPDLVPSQIPDVANSLASYFGITIDAGAIAVIQNRTDRTFQSLIYYIKYEKYNGNSIITEDIARLRFVGAVKQIWEKIYLQFIKPKSNRVAIVDALGILKIAGLPFYSDLVVEIATRLMVERKPISLRRRNAIKALRQVEVWFRQENGLVIAHDAALQDNYELTNYVDLLVNSIMYLIASSSEKANKLYNPIYNFENLLENLDIYEPQVRLLACLTKHFDSSAFAHYSLSSALHLIGDLSAALTEINKAVLLDPSNPIFHVVKGDLLYTLGNINESILSHSAALKMTSRDNSSSSYFLYEYSLPLQIVSPYSAEACFQYILTTDPSYISAQCALAESYLIQGHLEKAQQEANKAFDIEPTSIGGRINLARTFRRFGKPDKAIQLLTDLRNHFRNDKSVFRLSLEVELAITSLQLRDTKTAIETARRGIHIGTVLLGRESQNIDALDALICLYLIVGEFENAYKISRKYLSICFYDGLLSRLIFSVNELLSIGIDPIASAKIVELITKYKVPSRPLARGNTIQKPSLSLSLFQAFSMKKIRNDALEMQNNLSKKQLVFEDPTAGIKIVIKGNQTVETFERNNQNEEETVKILNVAIKATQELAAKALQETGLLSFKSHNEESDNSG